MISLSLFARQLQAERRKGRRRHLILLPLIFLSFQILWGFWQLAYASEEELRTGYVLLFHHLPIMNTLLLPMMVSVTASRLCDMEIKGDTLKLLYTMQKQATFYDCKYLAGLWYLLLFTFGQGIMILAFGQICHFGDTLKWPMLFCHLAVTISVSSVLLSFEQALSLMSPSQLLPLFAGLTGCFLGLFSLFFPKKIARFFIWGYYSAFPVASMDWDASTRISHYYEVPFPLTDFLLFLIAAVAVYQLCKSITVRKEV